MHFTAKSGLSDIVQRLTAKGSSYAEAAKLGGRVEPQHLLVSQTAWVDLTTRMKAILMHEKQSWLRENNNHMTVNGQTCFVW